jgi:hypothetical protein
MSAPFTAKKSKRPKKNKTQLIEKNDYEIHQSTLVASRGIPRIADRHIARR